MINVSDEFKTAMSATTRQCFVKVKFRQVDIDAAGDATTSVSGQHEISNISQLATGNLIQMNPNYASFETGRWKTDGSFVLPPESGTAGDVGWWSDQISDVYGQFGNLLGRLENVSDFILTDNRGTISLDTDPAKVLFGNNSIKLSTSTTLVRSWFDYDITSFIDPNKYYLISAYAQSSGFDPMYLAVYNDGVGGNSGAYNFLAGAFNRRGIVWGPNDFPTSYTYIRTRFAGWNASLAAGVVGWFDGIQLIEISVADYVEYQATKAQSGIAVAESAILAKYPYATNPTLTFTFGSTHSSIGFTVTFDVNNNEYSENFIINAYDESDALIESINVIGNTKSVCEVENPVSNYKKIEIVITKWSKSYRRARVLEVVFGILKVYTGTELTDFGVLEEISTTSKQISSNELNFSIDNQDKKFDFFNPSGVYAYMQKTMRIETYIGVDTGVGIEYANTGKFYLVEWNSKNDGLIASFKARDKLDLMTGSTYKKGLYQSRTLYNLVVDVLTDFGFTSSDYNIDTALSSITVYSYMPKLSYRDALQLIAVAGMAVVYVDRDDIIQIKQLTSPASTYTLEFANSYAKPVVELAPIIKSVEVSSYSFNSDSDSSELFKGTQTITGTVDMWVDYSPATEASASVSSGSINSSTYYTSGALLNITASGSVTITVTGKKLNAYKTPIVVTNSTDGVSITVDNILISDPNFADSVADWVIAEEGKQYKSKSSNWRQNPMLEAGDIITVENVFSSFDARITKQNIKFNGALSGETEVFG